MLKSNFIKTTLLFIYLSLVTACSYSAKFHEVIVNQQYALSFPAYMEAAEAEKPLHPTASLQYLNYFRNIYTIVVDEKKSNQNFANFVQKRYGELLPLLSVPKKVDSTASHFNEQPLVRIGVAGEVLGQGDTNTEIYYQLVFIESPTHYYQITFWTWDEWRQKYLPVINQIVSSFRELSPKNKED